MVHTPLIQAYPEGQVVLQPPQLVGLDVRSTHCVPHSVVPDGQAQLPFEHTWPVAQLTPHAPQLPGSVR